MVVLLDALPLRVRGERHLQSLQLDPRRLASLLRRTSDCRCHLRLRAPRRLLRVLGTLLSSEELRFQSLRLAKDRVDIALGASRWVWCRTALGCLDSGAAENLGVRRRAVWVCRPHTPRGSSGALPQALVARTD